MSDLCRSRARLVAFVTRGALVLCFGLAMASAAVAAPRQRSFATPDEAVGALIEAVRGDDLAAVLAVLGPSAQAWIRSGDQVADGTMRDRFVSSYEQKHGIASVTDTRAVLTIGPDDWPFAFPLVKSRAGWRFDTDSGKRELLARRIGDNELAAMNVLLAIVDAQREYASADRNRDGVREYARRFASTPGTRDGLYWPSAPSEPPSPLGSLVTQAAGEGYGGRLTPYHGYYFRLLTAQGPHAKGGAMDYIVRGHMIAGFAAIAYPAQYANSGVMTFIVDHDGIVYEKDLGRDTAKLARSITRFDPGPGWSPAKPD